MTSRGSNTRTRFTNKKNEAWYRKNEHHAMVVEKFVSPDVVERFELNRIFEHFQWEEMTTLRGDYYPELVKEFYANMENKGDADYTSLATIVRGHNIVVTTSSLASLFGLPNEGTRLHVKIRKVFRDPRWDVQAALAHFDIRRDHKQRILS